MAQWPIALLQYPISDLDHFCVDPFEPPFDHDFHTRQGRKLSLWASILLWSNVKHPTNREDCMMNMNPMARAAVRQKTCRDPIQFEICYNFD